MSTPLTPIDLITSQNDSQFPYNRSRPRMPCVVQLGFSGSRSLYDVENRTLEDIARIDAEIEAALRQRLRALRHELELKPDHFLAGVSQIAIGGDMHFTRCCGSEGGAGIAMQRILLPQPVDCYLAASGSRGPDFSPAQRAAALELLQRPAIVHVQCISNAASRAERFEDASHAILSMSDVAVCLLRKNAPSKRGGTVDFLELARRTQKPTLVMLVEVSATGAIVCSSTWHDREHFTLPGLPGFALHVSPKPEWSAESLPSATAYCETLKEYFSRAAQDGRGLFERMARVVLHTHLGATVCAAMALALAVVSGEWVFWILVALLGTELALLSWGYRTHHALDHDQIVRVWARARLPAEIARSVIALGNVHVYLGHLAQMRILPVPNLDRLLGTISWLHLGATLKHAETDPEKLRHDYVRNRIDNQLEFYRKRSAEAKASLLFARRRFKLWWTLGFGSTALKLAEVLLETVLHAPGWLAAALGVFAVVFPVLAVGVLSWASAMDLEANASEFAEMVGFLEKQKAAFQEITTIRPLRRAMLDTEAGILAEVSQWYVRRSYRSGPT
ncbi:MAG: hypothetical protein Q8N18_03650 [Opitutaceae bacterium]|nr:hypothetical protein [Opitutaceae bacterium]